MCECLCAFVRYLNTNIAEVLPHECADGGNLQGTFSCSAVSEIEEELSVKGDTPQTRRCIQVHPGEMIIQSRLSRTHKAPLHNESAAVRSIVPFTTHTDVCSRLLNLYQTAPSYWIIVRNFHPFYLLGWLPTRQEGVLCKYMLENHMCRTLISAVHRERGRYSINCNLGVHVKNNCPGKVRDDYSVRETSQGCFCCVTGVYAISQKCKKVSFPQAGDSDSFDSHCYQNTSAFPEWEPTAKHTAKSPRLPRETLYNSQ